MAEHAGQWLYEEGMAYWDGLNFKIKDQNRGQLMVEASASSGFPLAVADCHYLGWNGTEKDFNCQVNKKPMDWVQFVTIMVVALLETTSRLVNGTPNQVHRKTVLPLSCLGGCCQNKTKAVELFEKSAWLGYGGAMYLLGTCCTHGRGVTTDATQSQEWLAKAVVQGCTPPTDVTN